MRRIVASYQNASGAAAAAQRHLCADGLRRLALLADQALAGEPADPRSTCGSLTQASHGAVT
jgi:hypothetical protein